MKTQKNSKVPKKYLRKTHSNRYKGGTPSNNKRRTFELLPELPPDQLKFMFFTYVKEGVVPATIEMLLSKTIDVNMVDPNGHTPLMIASKYGHHKIVKLLLQNNAKPNIENKFGWTAIDFATEYLLNKNLSREEILGSELFLSLANAGARPGSTFIDDVIPSENTREYRHKTTSPGDDNSGGKVKKYSRKQKGGTEDEDNQLLKAIDEGNIDTVKKLLDKERHWFYKANVNARTYYNDTALINASSMGHTKIVEVLLNNGADVNAKNGSGNTALIIASSMGYIKIVEMLLKKGADLDASNNLDETALMAANENGHKEVVEMLLDNGADVKTIEEIHKGVLSNAQNRFNFLKEKRQNNENLKESRENDLQECNVKILKKQEDEKEKFLKKQEDEKVIFLKKCFEHINRKYITTPTDNVLKNPDLTRKIAKYLREKVGGKTHKNNKRPRKHGRKTYKNKIE